MTEVDPAEVQQLMTDLIECEQAGCHQGMIQMGPYTQWLLISVIQVTLTHPDIERTPSIAGHLRRIGMELQGRFANRAFEILEMGWDRANDVPVVDAKLPGRGLEYVLWSLKRDAWWRPNALGYTEDITEAGRFSYDEAVTEVMQAAYAGYPGLAPMVAPECRLENQPDPVPGGE